MDDGQRRDIIVIGASLGGVEALSELVAGLPEALPATVLIVQHTSAESPALLGEILAARGVLPAQKARDGMVPEPGHVYVAPPDRHLLLAGDRIRVAFGPRENRSRPAIDPLFRTAAVHHGPRVTGVILTGLLGDGVAGLTAVHRCGGTCIVQDPEDAAYPDMPRRALRAVPTAHQCRLDEIPRLLERLVHEPAPPAQPVPDGLRIEAELTERAMRGDDWTQVPGRSTDFTCPECSGALREVEDGDSRRFRCRVGHAYGMESLVAAKDDAVEEALWIALQTLEERVQMLETMASEDERRGWARTAAGLQTRARETREYAQRLRDFVQRLGA